MFKKQDELQEECASSPVACTDLLKGRGGKKKKKGKYSASSPL